MPLSDDTMWRVLSDVTHTSRTLSLNSQSKSLSKYMYWDYLLDTYTVALLRHPVRCLLRRRVNSFVIARGKVCSVKRYTFIDSTTSLTTSLHSFLSFCFTFATHGSIHLALCALRTPPSFWHDTLLLFFLTPLSFPHPYFFVLWTMCLKSLLSEICVAVIPHMWPQQEALVCELASLLSK